MKSHFEKKWPSHLRIKVTILMILRQTYTFSEALFHKKCICWLNSLSLSQDGIHIFLNNIHSNGNSWLSNFNLSLKYSHNKALEYQSDIKTLRLRQNGCHFPDDICKCIFSNENVWVLIKSSLKFVSSGPINNIPALVQLMAWCRPGDKPLAKPIMA